MTKIEQLLDEFFIENPDIIEARNKGVVNRSALAKYIIDSKNLDVASAEALITALRRYESKESHKRDVSIFKHITISTKDNIALLHLKKNEDVAKKLGNLFSLVNFNRNETLKIVQSVESIKLFIDEKNIPEISKKIGPANIEKTYKHVSELNILFPTIATETKGIISLVSNHLFFNDVNIIEFLSSTPELIVYVDSKDLVKAYSTFNRLKESN